MDICIISFNLNCVMRLKQFHNIATKVSSRKKCYYVWWSAWLITYEFLMERWAWWSEHITVHWVEIRRGPFYRSIVMCETLAPSPIFKDNASGWSENGWCLGVYVWNGRVCLFRVHKTMMYWVVSNFMASSYVFGKRNGHPDTLVCSMWR